MQELRTSEVLDLAADEIDVRGWIQAGAGDGDPWGGGADSLAPACMEGGILAAMGLRLVGGVPPMDFKYCPAYKAVQEYLGMRPLEHIFSWNDERGRTQQEVTGVLRAAAAAQRLKEAPYELDDQPLPVQVPSEVAVA